MSLKKTLIILLSLVIYYQIDYKRNFISNESGSKSFTLWKRLGNTTYIVPGKYYFPFAPSENYIKTKSHRNYIGVVFNAEESENIDISIYNEFETNNLNSNYSLFNKNDSLMLKYNILDSTKYIKGVREYSNKSTELIKKYQFKYIDLNRIYGIKIWSDINDKQHIK